MKRAVVTGAGGFLGRALTDELLNSGIDVLAVTKTRAKLYAAANYISAVKAVDNCPSKDIETEYEDYDSLADLTDIESLDGFGTQWDVFYHLAWEGTSGERRGDPDAQLANAALAVSAVKAAKRLGCRAFVGAGSIMESEVYAAARQGKPAEPGHIYSAAKLCAHLMSRSVASALDISHIWAKITNVYGEGERSSRLICSTLQRVLRNQPLEFSHARQNYDFLHVSDACRALRLIGQSGRPLREYAIGSGNARPLREFIEELCEVTQAQPPRFGAIKSGGINLPLSEFDIGKLTFDTGFLPKVTFKEGIARTFAELKALEA